MSTSNSTQNKIVRVAAAIIIKDHKFLIAKRSGKRHLSGLWEFPGGKIEANENPTHACIREIKEELNIDIIVLSYFLTTEYAYDDFDLKMDLFICQMQDEKQDIHLSVHEDYQFIDFTQIEHFDFAPANTSFLPQLKAFMHTYQKCCK